MERVLLIYSKFYKYINSALFYLATIFKEVQMNYLISILSILVVVLFLFVRNLYNDNKQLEENNKLIITAYESSIETLENKAKFEKEILIKKEPVIKASEKVKIEVIKRGEIEKVINTNNNDFFIVSF